MSLKLGLRLVGSERLATAIGLCAFAAVLSSGVALVQFSGQREVLQVLSRAAAPQATVAAVILAAVAIYPVLFLLRIVLVSLLLGLLMYNHGLSRSTAVSVAAIAELVHALASQIHHPEFEGVVGKESERWFANLAGVHSVDLVWSLSIALTVALSIRLAPARALLLGLALLVARTGSGAIARLMLFS